MSVSASAKKMNSAQAAAASKSAKESQEKEGVKYQQTTDVADVDMEEFKEKKGKQICQRCKCQFNSEGILGVMKPKIPKSAYIFFSQETITRLLEEQKDSPDRSMTECAKQAGAIWKGLSDEDKSKWVKAHEDDVKRYQKQCEEMDKNGYFMTDDGQKSCDVPVKVKKPVNAPSVKTRDRGTQTLKVKSTKTETKSRGKSESPPKSQSASRKRVRSAKGESPAKIMRDMSFGATNENAKLSQTKRKKIDNENLAQQNHQAIDGASAAISMKSSLVNKDLRQNSPAPKTPSKQVTFQQSQKKKQTLQGASAASKK